MKIAILGWGSLLWEGGADFDRWHGPWKHDGPILKLEFSRVSEKRLKALTLVIDTENGIETTVAWCLSKRPTLADAMCDLRSREGTTLDNIGRVTIAPEAKASNCGLTEDAIAAWARTQNVDAIIWTDLKSNFQQKTTQPFSVGAVVSHLKTLTPEGKVKAAEYIWRAPEFVKTPVRTALQREPWFSDAESTQSPTEKGKLARTNAGKGGGEL
jgi:hypothetical protein